MLSCELMPLHFLCCVLRVSHDSKHILHYQLLISSDGNMLVI